MPNGAVRRLHANKLRKFIVPNTNVLSVINESDSDFGNVEVLSLPDNLASAQTAESLPSELIDLSTLQHLTQSQLVELLDLLDTYADCFSEIPGFCGLVEHEIKLLPGFVPRSCRPYKVPEALKPQVDQQIEMLLKHGFITKSNSPMASGVVCVLKHDGHSVRLAIDYRYLNKYTESTSQPMPNLRDSIYKVSRAHCLSLCDVRHGYWNINVKKEHRFLTSFVTHDSQYEWVRMPFGLKCSNSTFLQAIRIMLRGLQSFCESFVDDLTVLSDLFSTHISFHLPKFLEVVRQSGMFLNLKKCRFAQNQLVYVGHLVGCGHHQPDPDRLKPIHDIKPPETKCSLRQCLGFTVYISRIILILLNH